MAKKIDLTNQRFGRLTVLRDSGKRIKYGHIIWACKCDCGKRVEIISGNLRYGHTRSCGCLQGELRKAHGRANIKHGENDKNSRLYTSWVNIKRRGRRIKVCKEWLDRKKGYLNFRMWAMTNGYTADPHSFIIARKDSRKNYDPSNCQLISKSELMRRIWKDRGDNH